MVRKRLPFMANKREFPLAQVYGLLEPGPVVLVTTCPRGTG